jgi:hypothetical protein
MGNFRVGDKVICINDDWGGKNLIYPTVSDIYEIIFPKQGQDKKEFCKTIFNM